MSMVHPVLQQMAARGLHPARLISDSRQVCPGDAFVAYRGESADGPARGGTLRRFQRRRKRRARFLRDHQRRGDPGRLTPRPKTGINAAVRALRR